MVEPAAARQVRVVPTEGGELRVPADLADLLGRDAQLDVGPGRS